MLLVGKQPPGISRTPFQKPFKSCANEDKLYNRKYMVTEIFIRKITNNHNAKKRNLYEWFVIIWLGSLSHKYARAQYLLCLIKFRSVAYFLHFVLLFIPLILIYFLSHSFPFNFTLLNEQHKTDFV